MGFPRQLVIVGLAAAGLSVAQRADEPAPEPQYRYSGTPIRLPFTCTAEDIADFGMRCTRDQPCPIYLDITSVESKGTLVIVAGSFHNSSTTMSTVLLRSTDGGTSWDEAYERIRGSALDRAMFLDESTGWVSGHLVTLPARDPFFLITTDGGKHWRQRDVLPEPGVGVIDGFWFDDDRSGTLLVDRIHADEAGNRYERYETMTGGASWSIREVSSSPIRVRNRVSVENEDWRAEPDSDSGAWLIQQRLPGGWATVAAYAIETAACTPPDPTARAEPEEETAPATPQSSDPGVFVIGTPPPAPQPERETPRP